MKLKDTKRMMVGLIGIDYDKLKNTSERNVNRFFVAAMFVVGILALSFTSVYYAFELMFHVWYVQIVLSLFFSLMFGVIYVLLIQTFSKQALAQKRRSRLNASNILRGAYILLIGFLISKPIEILALSIPLQKDIENYKRKLNDSFESQTNTIYAPDINKLQSRIAAYQSISGTESYLSQLSDQLNKIEAQKQTEIDQAGDRIDHSKFFLQRINYATKDYPVSWVICVVIVAIFFVPAVLVYAISSNNKYYSNKKKDEHERILNHYLSFRTVYTQAFIDHLGLAGVEFYESHTDPPFRTERIPAPACDSETDFFNRFKGHGLPQRLL